MEDKFYERTKTIINQVGLNTLYKGGAILVFFFFVPLSIDFLGTHDYGVWLTLFSFVAFFNFFDFGLGHGLRNYLTTQLTNKNFKLAKEYISTAYITIFIIGLVLILFFLTFVNFINWQLIFKVDNDKLVSFLFLIKVVFVFFFLNLSLKLINVVFFASLKPSIPGFFLFLNNFISFGIIYVLLKFNNGSLVIYGSVILGVQSLVFILANIFMFSTKFKHIRPSFFSFRFALIRDIFGLGSKFLILQIAAVILYSSDNMIITQLFSPNEVSIYNISYKYFSVFPMLSTLFVAPLWSAITDAQSSNDIKWIKSTIKSTLKLISILSLFSILGYFISDFVYKFWVGEKIIVPELLSLFMSIYVISSMFLQVFSIYLNGVGKIKLQVLIGSFIAVINIPLSIFFAKYLNIGLPGIILATLVCNLISLFFLSHQYYKIINNRAKGLWNE